MPGDWQATASECDATSYATISPRDQAVFRVSYNAAFLSTGGIAEAGITSALTAAALEAASANGPVAGASIVRLPAPPVSVNILANPQASFEWYLQALVDPAVLHLLVACAAAMAMGRALHDRSLADWRWRAEVVQARSRASYCHMCWSPLPGVRRG